MQENIPSLSGRWLIVAQSEDNADSLQWALEDEGCSCTVVLPQSLGHSTDTFTADFSAPEWAKTLLNTLDHQHNPFNGVIAISEQYNNLDLSPLFAHASQLHLPGWLIVDDKSNGADLAENLPETGVISVIFPIDEHIELVIAQLRHHAGQTRQHTLSHHQQVLNTLPPNQQYHYVFELLKQCLHQVLGVAKSTIAAHSSFVDLGVNSLKMLPLKDALNAITGLSVPVSALYDYVSPDSLTIMLLTQLNGNSAQMGTEKELESDSSNTQIPVACIGMACHFPPNLTSPEAFFEALLKQHNGVREKPQSRGFYGFDHKEQSVSSTGSNPSLQQAYLEDIFQFDAPFFGVSPREASAIDPQQRLLLTLSWQALHNACKNIPSLSGASVGTYMAIGEPDYRNSPNAQSATNGLITTGTHVSMAAGRIAHILGLQGPAMVINTACSSSLVAVDMACNGLSKGDCELALAGGANLMLSDEGTVGMNLLGALSPTNQCRTFDANANGYVRGEGAAVVVLKKLSDAQRDGDSIRAVILGSAVNHDGKSQGLTAPNGLAQQKVMQKALSRSGVPARSISYVETHGTGTPLGDPVELHALNAIYNSAEHSNNKQRNTPLLVGSHKPNIGHLEQAAGISGLVKTVLCLEQQQLPGNIHFATPNPQIVWSEMNIEVVTENRPWQNNQLSNTANPFTEDFTLRAGVSSFGFSGTNCHMILEAPPKETTQKTTEKTKEKSTETTESNVHVLLLSAHHPDSLKEMLQRYLEQLQNKNESTTQQICYTARQLTQHKYRLALSGANNTALTAQLKGALTLFQPQCSKFMPQIAFVFAGQGSQFNQMAQKWYQSEPAFKAQLDRCDALARPWLNNASLVALLTESTDQLAQTRWTQPALFAFHTAMLALWQHYGITPAIVAGHSLGEYSAAYAAGILSLGSALKLVCERGKLIDSKLIDSKLVDSKLMSSLPTATSASQANRELRNKTGAMLAVTGAAENIALLLPQLEDLFGDQQLAIAAKNSPEQIVLSGFSPAIATAKTRIDAMGACLKVRQLNVSHGFHSPQMNAILPAFGEFLSEEIRTAHGTFFSSPNIDIISNLTGKPATQSECQSREYWLRHLKEPVDFNATCAWLHQHADIVVEINAHPLLQPQLSHVAHHSKRQTQIICSGNRRHSATQDIAQMLGKLYCAGVPVNESEFFSHQNHQQNVLPPPLYPMRTNELMLPQAVHRHSSGSSTSTDLSSSTKALSQPTSQAETNEQTWFYQRHWQALPWSAASDKPELSNKALAAQWVILGGQDSHFAATLQTQWTNKSLEVTRFEKQEDFINFLDHATPLPAGVDLVIVDMTSVEMMSAEMAACDNKQANGQTKGQTNPDLASSASATATSPNLATHITSQTVETLKALATSKAKQTESNFHYWLCTQQAQRVTGDENLQAHLAPLWGLGRSLAMEQPDIWRGLIDLDTTNYRNSENIRQQQHNNLHTMANWLLQTLSQQLNTHLSPGFQQLAIRQTFQTNPSHSPTAKKPALAGTMQSFRAGLQPATPFSTSENTPHLAEGLLQNKTIVITGGLGFIGLQLIAQLVANGATRLVVTTRQTQPTEPEIFEQFRQQNVVIQIYTCDLNSPTATRALLKYANEYKPLGGIIHLAGQLNDAVLANITQEQIEATFASKLTSCWQLHQASLLFPEAFLILFSSAASVFGSPGQSIYAAANSYLEALAQVRTQQGLLAKAFHWGALTSAQTPGGMYASLDDMQQHRLGQLGLRPLLVNKAMKIFTDLLALAFLQSPKQSTSSNELTIIDIDWETWATKHGQNRMTIADQFQALVAPYLSSQYSTPSAPNNDTTTPDLAVKKVIEQARANPTDTQCRQTLEETLKQVLLGITSNVLQLPVNDIDMEMPLTDQGLDSILSMEILNDIRSQLDLMLYPNELARFDSIRLLSEYLLCELLVDKATKALVDKNTTAPAKANVPEGKSKTFVPVLPEQKLANTSFVLSTPRAGSTLLRAMLAGHSQLFVPPELHLLSYATMGQRAETLKHSDLSEGLQRALMEFGLTAQQASDKLIGFEQQNVPVWQVYQCLLHYSHSQQQPAQQTQILIDKSPVYAANKSVLLAAEAMFSDAKYIHLIRHPIAVIESFVRMRLHQVAGEHTASPYEMAENIWLEYNQNILQFFAEIDQNPASKSNGKVVSVHYEQLVAQPKDHMQQIAGLLGVPYQASMLTPYTGKRMTNGVHGHSMGVGDPNFLQHKNIDKQHAEKWQTQSLPITLNHNTISLAEQLGYVIPQQYHPTRHTLSTGKENKVTPSCEAVESYFSVQGHKLCLCQWGELTDSHPPIMVLLHGLQDQALIWQPVAEQLVQQGFVVFAPDLRGHGRSSHSESGYSYPLLNYVNDLEQTLAHIQSLSRSDQPVYLTGHSLGAAIAATYTHLFSANVAQLLLVEPVLLANESAVSSPAVSTNHKPIENKQQTSKNINSLPSSLQLQLRSSLNHIQQPHQHASMDSVQQAANLLQQTAPSLSNQFALKLAQRATTLFYESQVYENQVDENQMNKSQSAKVKWRWDPVLSSRAGMGFPGTRQQYLQLLSEINTTPFSVLFGANSQFNRPEDLHDFNRATPQASKSTISGGHSLPLDNPDAICQWIATTRKPVVRKAKQ